MGKSLSLYYYSFNMKLCSWSDLVLATLPLRSLGAPVFLLSFNNVNNINPILHLCFLFHFFFYIIFIFKNILD